MDYNVALLQLSLPLGILCLILATFIIWWDFTKSPSRIAAESIRRKKIAREQAKELFDDTRGSGAASIKARRIATSIVSLFTILGLVLSSLGAWATFPGLRSAVLQWLRWANQSGDVTPNTLLSPTPPEPRFPLGLCIPRSLKDISLSNTYGPCLTDSPVSIVGAVTTRENALSTCRSTFILEDQHHAYCLWSIPRVGDCVPIVDGGDKKHLLIAYAQACDSPPLQKEEIAFNSARGVDTFQIGIITSIQDLHKAEGCSGGPSTLEFEDDNFLYCVSVQN